MELPRIHNKEAELLIRIDGLKDKPAVIVLQELNSKPRLLGYGPDGGRTTVLVRSNRVAN